MRRKRLLTMWLTAAIGMIAIARGAETREAELNRHVKPYSNQQIVWLNVNETYVFKLRGGAQRAVRLVSVREHRDRVVNLMRRAEVRLEIDGRPLDLVCEPYVMPTETAGLRLQVDSTSGWGNIPKQVQLSLWDARDPIVDTKKFVFPIRNYRLFSHGTQAYNEPVHLGAGDDDPAGQRFYHDYGFDIAGFEGGEDVLSAVEGKVVSFWPSRDDVCTVIIQDRTGLNWEHAHLKSIEPEIMLNTQVARGQKIGVLGKNGPSGNFSHLHLGIYLSMQDLEVDNRSKRLNLYPWLVTAYKAQHPKALLAVARPHHIALTGEKVVLDGSHSLAWGGGKIVSYLWVFPDGQTVNNIRAEKTFDRPGAYVAELWVKDDHGAEDVDFCQIKVFTKDNPEKGIPHIYMSYTPTEEIRPDQPVRFRFWIQGSGGGPIRVDFDDGTRLENYQEYSEFQHRFKTPGIHVVTAQCEADGKPIVQKLKVVVDQKM
jgi:murein DD-endopeptidase MepM/ murein hydrolase activator NlpD